MAERSTGRAVDLKVTERISREGRGGGAMVGQKASDFSGSLRRLLARLAPQRLKLVGVVGFAVLSVFGMSLGPKLLGDATDVVVDGYLGRPDGGTGVNFDDLGHALGLVALVYAGASLLAWLQGLVLNSLVLSTVRELRGDVESKVHRLPLDFFDRQARGEVLSRVTNDIDNLNQTLQQTLSQLLSSVLTVVFVLGMMIWISPLMAVIAVVSVPVAMLISGAVMKRSQAQFIAQWRQTGQLNAHIEETFSGMELVKVFGRQTEVEEIFKASNDRLYASSFKAQFISGLIMPLMMFVGNLNFVAICVVGGLRVTSGNITIGDLQAFIQYSRQFTQPITQIASMANLMQSGIASAERVFELLDAPEQTPDPVDRDVTMADLGGEVCFEDVSFSYVPDEPLICGLSLRVRPGQTVAIVGPTGAGKTTLVNLVMRFYDLDGGRITLDGVDITQMPRHQVRSRIGMVLQDTWLFTGTIRDNITYGRPEASEEEMLAAARATFVDRFVHSLPDGYDTVVADDAGNLSAGERQLVTIARAFLAQPDLLILDEATSSVDTRTELLVQQAMRALRSDRTSFVIAHRLSTIRDADVILVMEAGAIVEQGSHDELLSTGGAYARLYAAQFAAPR